MDVLPPMVDMARTPKEAEDQANPSNLANQPLYPYGLCISLTQDELDKLNLDDSDVEVGDMVHLFAMCKVTSISKNDTEAGKSTRIEMQITHIACEDEDEENEATDRASPVKTLYR